MVGVYAEGISDMKKEMEDMQKWDMKSFAISDYKAISDEKDVMVTTYTVTIEGTFDGKDASGTYNAGSVWKLENGKWLAIFHTNVKQAGPNGGIPRHNLDPQRARKRSALPGSRAPRYPALTSHARVLFWKRQSGGANG